MINQNACATTKGQIPTTSALNFSKLIHILIEPLRSSMYTEFTVATLEILNCLSIFVFEFSMISNMNIQ